MPNAATTKIARAVVREDASHTSRLLDKAFAFAFKGLVYAQIWEDPVVDMQALGIQPDSRIVTIASGSCNALSYLTANPAHITAVDLNTAHIALGKLKIAAAQHLPDYEYFRRFFVQADLHANLVAYRRYLRPVLDETSQRYWEGRDLTGRRRIHGFRKGIYRRGLLGNFIGLAHFVARLNGLDPRELLSATSLEEQQRIFVERYAPVFDKRIVRWLTEQRASLFGLGIPPAQYDALAGDSHMADVLRQRLEKLAAHFPVNDNYFAWQAFSRGYGREPGLPLPPYLQPQWFETVRDRASRIDLRHASFTEFLAGQPDSSQDRYILLDAQDWMDDGQLGALWSEITRTARPGARVLFRTAAEPTLLPGRVPEAILSRWDYAEADSARFTKGDRSSIYGGVHLYVLKP
ncbi:MAG: DUF3419 family protein [Sphingomonadales bacterium]|nr:DUF3419 family protein [Sphingomonadales bacterium]